MFHRHTPVPVPPGTPHHIQNIWAALWENVPSYMSHDVRPTKTQISLRLRAVWLESSLSASRNFASLAIQNARSEDSDQTARMCRLIWTWAGRTCPMVRFLTLRVKWCALQKNLYATIEQQWRKSASSHPPPLLNTRSLIRHSLFIDTFYSIHWLWKRAAQVLIRLRECAGWSGPSLPAYGIKSLSLRWASYDLTVEWTKDFEFVFIIIYYLHDKTEVILARFDELLCS